GKMTRSELVMRTGRPATSISTAGLFVGAMARRYRPGLLRPTVRPRVTRDPRARRHPTADGLGGDGVADEVLRVQRPTTQRGPHSTECGPARGGDDRPLAAVSASSGHGARRTPRVSVPSPFQSPT